MGKGDLKFAVSWEEYPWHADQPASSRRERLRARGPYSAAIPAAIADLHLDISSETLAEAADAEAEIVRFDADISHALPAIDGGEVAPLAAVLLRSESASSSQIENVTAGAKALALATIHERSGPNATMVVGNVEAMRTAIALSDNLGLDSILQAHAALMAAQQSAEPGRFRTQQVWIGGRGSSPHTAQFVPPHPTRLETSLDDLMMFCARTDVPSLVHASVAHAQFETIHPFVDGNGRVGRALVHAMLRRSGTTRRLTVPVSAGLLADTSSYFEALTNYRAGEVDPIVSCFSQAAFAAVSNGRDLVADLSAVFARWQEAVRARSDASVWKVLPLLLHQPAISVRTVRATTGISQPAAQTAIDTLLSAGAIAPASQNRRNRVWIATEVIDALDEFAVRAGKRDLGAQGRLHT